MRNSSSVASWSRLNSCVELLDETGLDIAEDSLLRLLKISSRELAELNWLTKKAFSNIKVKLIRCNIR